MEAREVNAPPGSSPVHWRLFTTHPVTTLADACQITRFYRQRWTIEQVFRVMKTKGFDIEAVRVAEDGPFENLTTATLIAAIEVLQMVRERDGRLGDRWTMRLTQKTVRPLRRSAKLSKAKPNGRKIPIRRDRWPMPVGYAPGLGGWTGYYGKPGPIVILHGLLSLKAMLRGWRIAQDV